MSDTHPLHVGHVHLTVRDVDRASDFYTDILGLSENAPGPGPGVGMYHAAFEVASSEALRNIFEWLQDREIRVSPVDHGISKALYFDDPAGNGLEVYLDAREVRGSDQGEEPREGERGRMTREQRERHEWQGQNEPFDPTAL